MQAVRKIQQRDVLKSLANEAHAEGQTIGTEAGGDGNG